MAESFLNRFMQKVGALGRPRGTGAAQVSVAAFGKHPGWDDHIPGIGLNDPELIEFKRWFYDGIIRNVDSGQWDALNKAGLLQPFAHTLLWASGAGWIVGRCWHSVDGKGRDRYPMIAVALCPDLPLSWVMREALPVTKSIEEQCRKIPRAPEVEQLIRTSEEALRNGVPREGVAPDPQADFEVVLRIAHCPKLGPDRQGFLRLLYHIEREMPPPRPSGKMLGVKPAAVRPFSLRVPLCAENTARSAELWTRFLRARPELPPAIFACAPDHGQWLELSIGTPGASQLFSMRAPVEVVPLTSDVPYTIEPEYVARISHFLENVRARGQAVIPAALWP